MEGVESFFVGQDHYGREWLTVNSSRRREYSAIGARCRCAFVNVPLRVTLDARRRLTCCLQS